MFIDSIQFMNSSHNKLVKNLSDEGFKYLVEEFSSKNLELLKKKVINIKIFLKIFLQLYKRWKN